MSYELSVIDQKLDKVFWNLGGKNFIRLNPSVRAEEICKFMQEDGCAISKVIQPRDRTNNLGLIVIKPEAQSFRIELIDLIQRQIKSDLIEINDIQYTLESYKKIYGQLYGQFLPGTSNDLGVVFPSLLFAGCTSTVTGIAFKYASNGMSPDDNQGLFKALVVGSGENHDPSTLRGQIRTTLDDLGFGSINTALARSFDITGELISRDPDKNLRTFNGLHSPDSTRENWHQVDVYFSDSQIERIIKKLK